jgi:adenosylhomocysteine nucleosidase
LSGSRNWIILAALKMEANAIASEMGPAQVVRDELVRLDSIDISMQVIGIGAKLLKDEVFTKFDRIILAGLGGALDPGLNIGDVVVDAPTILPSPGTPGEGRGGGLFRTGKIFPSDHLITSVEEKQRIFRESGCIAVDMESVVVRRQCEEAGKEFIHIRAISDRADEALPERLASWVDDVGEPKMAKVSAELMFRPGLVPVLMRLQSNSKLALRNLTAVIKSIVATDSQP